jgi:hypothetical protein
MRAQSCRLVVGAIAVVLALWTVAPADASHSHPATYTGSFSGSGLITFDVSGDGRAVTRIRFRLNTACGPQYAEYVVDVPIVDHAFTYTFAGVTTTGSFRANQTATGIVRQAPCTSNPVSWSATTTAPPAIPPTPTPPPQQPPPDTAAPVTVLSGPTTQRTRRRVTVDVASNENATARATGSIRVRRSHRPPKRFRLRTAVAQLAANATARLQLRVPKKARAAIARALGNHRVVIAVVEIKVRDAAGNTSSQTRIVHLRRR